MVRKKERQREAGQPTIQPPGQGCTDQSCRCIGAPQDHLCAEQISPYFVFGAGTVAPPGDLYCTPLRASSVTSLKSSPKKRRIERLWDVFRSCHI
jgi:hypothetical protein